MGPPTSSDTGAIPHPGDHRRCRPVAARRLQERNAKIKQYHKQGRALRTETTINNPHDFGVTKRLTSLPDLRQNGFTANRRLLGVQTISHDPIRGAKAFTELTAPVRTRIAGLRFGDNRVHALATAPGRLPPLPSTDSPTVSCAPSPRPSSANDPRTSPPGR